MSFSQHIERTNLPSGFAGGAPRAVPETRWRENHFSFQTLLPPCWSSRAEDIVPWMKGKDLSYLKLPSSIPLMPETRVAPAGIQTLPSFLPSIHPSIHPSIYLSIHPPFTLPSFLPPTYPSIHPSPFHPSFHLLIQSSILHPSIFPSIHPLIYPSTQPSIHPSIHPSIIHPSFHSSICPSRVHRICVMHQFLC